MSQNTIFSTMAGWTLASLLLAFAGPAALASPQSSTYSLGEIGRNSSFPTLSADGRYVAYATPLSSPRGNIFVYDRISGSNVQADLTATGMPSKGLNTNSPIISADGRYVVFRSMAADMGLSDNKTGVFLYDRLNNVTRTIYIGILTNTPHRSLGISSDGRYVAYRALSAPTSIESTIYIYDTVNNNTQPITTTHALVGNHEAIYISDDGRHVSYMGRLSAPSAAHILVHDRLDGTTQTLSGAWSFSMSADGKAISFVASAKLLPGDTGTRRNV